jgi:hypothetical protein
MTFAAVEMMTTGRLVRRSVDGDPRRPAEATKPQTVTRIGITQPAEFFSSISDSSGTRGVTEVSWKSW